MIISGVKYRIEWITQVLLVFTYLHRSVQKITTNPRGHNYSCGKHAALSHYHAWYLGSLDYSDHFSKNLLSADIYALPNFKRK